jgi:small subunit ribosomal protein S16
MAVRIRLRRTGKKKEVHYRVVVAEARTAREGRFIENIGYVNPRVDPPEIRLDAERARLWLKRGAQPTDTVKSILVREGIWQKTEPAQKSPNTTQAEGHALSARPGQIRGDAEATETREEHSDIPRGEVGTDAGTHRNDSQGSG